MRYRYRKEPWLPPVLEIIASQEGALLEVGCGQGTDGVYICSRKKNGSYTGVDLSGQSIENAKTAARHFTGRLGIVPLYQTGNAESLEFADESFDAVFSCGVLHHSPDPMKAIAEIRRVLKKGGTGYIYLYRSASPKVLTARVLRLISGIVDGVTLQDRLIWKTIKRFGSDHRFGTMILECFGAPILRSYTQSRITEMFSIFSEVEIGFSGTGIPGTNINRVFDDYTGRFFGTMWQIVCKK
jgi:ubiquinone/menaquinone biosynthesis C-methylase UbiE